MKKVRLEIAINDDFEQVTIDTIVNTEKKENIGSGKIFIMSLERCIRIRTEEEGDEAIG